jgi:hypothetical protein
MKSQQTRLLRRRRDPDFRWRRPGTINHPQRDPGATGAARRLAGRRRPHPATTPVPPAEATPANPATTGAAAGTTTTTTTTAQPSADTAAAPTSAAVGADFKVGTEIKDPAGVTVGTISGSSVAADGSTNVVVTNGAVKFALPGASLSTNAGVTSTTATKAQIDATLAGAKPK